MQPTPVLFHPRQLAHKPVYEWAFGRRLPHPETSRRAENIAAALEADERSFRFTTPPALEEEFLARVHDPRLAELYRTAAGLDADRTFYPSVFPLRATATVDPTDIHHAGYFCFDSGSPLHHMTFEAARWSASCAHEASRLVAVGEVPLAYALCRPPGHHASRDMFGGYCYFNNAAIAALPLGKRARVAIVDIDFHHGNGTQDLFYRSSSVLFVSIHGDPREFYPYYSGRADERGAGRGVGFNVNLPLPRGCDGQEYLRVIDERVVPTIRDFDPRYLVISAGFDTYKKDPIGAFALETDDYHALGERLARLALPTVVVQEGGYFTAELGSNARSFLLGLRDGLSNARPAHRRHARRATRGA